MGKKWPAGLLLFVLCGLAYAGEGEAKKSDGAQYVGTWAGTWDGAGSGKFDLTLEKGEDGKVKGGVAVTTDNGDYNAKFKSLAFEGNKMTAKYDFPLDDRSEVAVAATFEGGAAKGTWTLRAKGEEADLIGGTWTVAKK